MRGMRWKTWVVLLAVFALVATACSGEVSEDTGDEIITGSDDSTSDDGGDSGEDDSSSGGDDSSSGSDDGGTDDGGDTTDSSSDEPTAGPNIYVDPRGGVFTDFQEGFDRGDHPFLQLDSFCVAHDAATDAVETDDGITADSISLVHLRSKLEDLIAFGFGVPVGETADMFEVFVDYVNTECGGVRGRQLELETIEVPAFGGTLEQDRNAACLQATEDFNAVVVMNSSGLQGGAPICLVEEKQTIFLSTQGQAQEAYERGDGRLVSLSHTNEENLRFTSEDLLATGLIGPGDVLGVASMDTPGQPESVQAGVVDVMEAAGVEVVFDVLGCDGGSICTGGLPQSVTNMKDAGITHFFNVMGILTAPGYIDEMVLQGFEPGDVQFFASDFNSQASELVSGQIANTPTSGLLYDGAIVIDFRNTGEYRAEGYAPTPFQDMCVSLYNENNSIGAVHAWDDEGDSAFGMVVSVCVIMRMALRSIYDAGDNPTPDDVRDALVNLGPVDLSGMIPASVTPDKGALPDVVQTMDWSYPCTQPLPFEKPDNDPVCLTGRGDYRSVNR